MISRPILVKQHLRFELPGAQPVSCRAGGFLSPFFLGAEHYVTLPKVRN
jgi:hypothetical protein